MLINNVVACAILSWDSTAIDTAWQGTQQIKVILALPVTSQATYVREPQLFWLLG